MKRYVIFGIGNIGFSLVEKLIENAEVFTFDQKKPECLKDLMQRKDQVSFTEVNAIDESSVENALQSLEPESIDGAILTVGIPSTKSAFEDMDSFKRTVTVNFFGNIIPIRILVKSKILRKPARIVVIASTSGHFAGVSTNAYAPSKWMLVNACQSIRAELTEQGITLDIVNPRTIKNVHSDAFKSGNGIEISDVTQAILKILRGGDCPKT